MGCVQAKPSPNSPPRGLDKLKLQSGYTPAPPKRSFSKGPNRGGPPRTRSVRGIGRNAASENGEKDGGGGDGKRERVEAPRPPPPKVRPPEERAAEEEVELVDGWPKWLTDNIPREALAGLVPRSADSYDKLAKVGQGTYSNVYKARDRDTGKIVALKKVRFDTSESESVRFMAREIMILQKLDHPNVIKLEGLATSRMQYSLYLVFDFMPSDLSRVISRPEGRLTEPQVKCYMHQLLSGLKHCHERGILHRDIKGSNLLIDKQGMLKIADFGLANYFNPNNKRPLTSRVVTLWYRAPELLLGTTDYGVGIDLWSAGCLLAEMFARRPIMPGRTEVEQLHRIFKLCGSPPEDYWRKLRLSTSFRPPQPYKPNIAETFRDFPSSSLGLLKILLALDPSYRESAASALQNEFFSINPLACDLSGLPVIYKEEDDESIRPRERRKRRSGKLKQFSRTQKEGPRNVDQDIMKPKTGDYELPIEKAGTYSHELGTGITGSTSSSVQPPRYTASIPSSLSPVNSPSFRENARVQATRSHERISSITHSTSSGVLPQRYSVSTPPSKSPVKSPSFRDTAGLQTRHSHELGSSTTGSTSSGVQVGRYSVSSPPFPPPVKTSSHRGQRTEAHPSATKNVQNLHSRHTSRASVNRSNNQRHGMEKRSVSTSGFGRFEGKQIPKR